MQSTTSRIAQPAIQANEPSMLLRIGAVVRTTGLGRSTIYRLITSGDFPAPVRLSVRAVAWRRSDVESWTSARPSTAH
jgi:prophage regulatory protein